MRNLSPASTPHPRSWSAATVASSCATGIQTLSPERPCELDATGSERVAERFAAARVGGRDVRDTRRFAGVAPHTHDEPLQEV